MAEYVRDDRYYTSSYYPGTLVARVINILFGIIEALLAVRIVLELLAANPAAPFIGWLYSLSDGLMGPFVGAFPNITLGGASFIDITALLAMIAYAIIGWLVLRLVLYIIP